MHRPRDDSSWTRKLTTYAIAGGAAVAFTPPVHANIIHVAPSPKPMVSQLGEGVDFLYLDLNADGVGDYLAKAQAMHVVGPVQSTFNTVVPLQAGWMVGPVLNLPYGASWSDIDATLNETKLHWPNDVNQPQYAGIQFDTSGETHFGWMRAGAAWDSENYSAQMKIHDWAYESEPNTPIVVGATSSNVPEPSSLALCALGAAGIALLKQRRKRAQS